MSTNDRNAEPIAPEAPDFDPAAEDPTAVDPMADEKVRLQLAIFEVTRDAGGKGLPEIRAMLRAAFSRHGVETPPETWVESVASSAFYGEPYIVDLEAAVTADGIVPAPNEEVRERLASRRQLQQEKLPAGIFPTQADWNIPGNEAAGGSTRTLSLPRWESGAVRALAALAVVAAVAVVAVRVGAGRHPVSS